MSTKLKAITSPPSREELYNRLERVKEKMEEQDLDYYVSFDPVNIYYLTNFAFYVHERPFILVIPIEGLPRMLIPLLEKGHFEERVRCDVDTVTYYEFPGRDGENWHDFYQDLIENNETEV